MAMWLAPPHAEQATKWRALLGSGSAEPLALAGLAGPSRIPGALAAWKVDLIVMKDRSFSRTEFDRRGSASLPGVEVSVASLEDVLLAKLEWSKLGDSELRRRGVTQLLERAGDRLDLSYVERWVLEPGLSDEWKNAQDRARFRTRAGRRLIMRYALPFATLAAMKHGAYWAPASRTSETLAVIRAATSF